MGVPTWVVVFAILYPALQVPALVYVVYRYDLDVDLDEVPHPRDGDYVTYAADAEQEDARDEADARSEATAAALDRGEAVRCPECGAPNAPSFDYCRVCVHDLAATAADPWE
jgi:hypothetical protein